MVDVPTPQEPLTQMPNSRVSAGDIKATYDIKAQQEREGDISQGLNALAGGLDAIAQPLAQEAGRRAGANAVVTRNADGTPVVQQPSNPLIMGNAGLAFQRAAEAGALARGQNAVMKDAADIRVAADGDPQKYLKDMQDYSTKLRAVMPDKLGDAMGADADRIGAQHYGSMLQQEHATTVQNSQIAIEAQLNAAKNEALAFARQPGGTNSADFKHAQARINGYYDQLTQNPLFNWPAEKAELEKKHFADYAFAENVTSAVDQTFTKKGRAEAAQLLEEQIVNNPKLGLNDAERAHFRQVGLSRLQYLSDLQRSDADALRATTTSMESALRDRRMRADDPALDLAIDRARQLGGNATEDVKRLEAAREIARRSTAFDGLNNQDRLGASVAPQPASPAAVFSPANLGRYLNRTQAIESGGNPNAVSPTGAVGPFQFTKATAAQYGVVNPFDVNQSRGGAARLAMDNAASLTQALGRPPTEGEVYLAHQQGPAGAAALLAHPNMNAVQALATYAYDGNVQKADQAVRVNGGNPSMTAGDFAAKWTGRYAGASPAFNYTPQQVRDNPWLLSAYAHSLSSDASARERIVGNVADGILNGIKAGQAPSAENLAMVQQTAETSPKIAEKFDKIRQAAEVDAQAGFVLGNRPGPEALQAADEYVRSTSGADILHQTIARGVRDEVQARVKALADNPFAEATRRAWLPAQPQPLDFNNPANLATAMQQRAVAAQAIASHERNPDQSMIEPAAVSQLKGIMTSGTADQRMALLSSIVNSGAQEPVLKATLGQLAADKDTLPLAVAGSLAKDNARAAEDILKGQALLQQEPKLAPKKEEIARSMSDSLPFQDFPNPQVRDGFEGAIKAYYAKLSADTNDVTGVLNQERWDTAVKTVTGGTYKFRGSRIVNPWYGANDGEVDGAIRSLTDADLANARTPSGEPFPAAALKPSFSAAFTWNNWRLQSQGDGKYLVFSGPDDPTKRVPLLDADTKRPFVLDLSSKRGQATAAPVAPYQYHGLGSSAADPLAGVLGR